MEKGVEDTVRVLRAIRSLNYNRRILPLIERRIETAEVTIRNHLLLRGASEDQVGPYEVRVDSTDNIGIKQTTFDEWNQMELPIQRDGELLDGGDFNSILDDPLEVRIEE